jgi:hypothetical protein
MTVFFAIVADGFLSSLQIMKKKKKKKRKHINPPFFSIDHFASHAEAGAIMSFVAFSAE